MFPATTLVIPRSALERAKLKLRLLNLLRDSLYDDAKGIVNMGTTGDQFRNFCVVVNVGKAEAWRAVGNDVQQIQAAFSGSVARLDEAGDWRIGANRLFRGIGKN